MAERPTPERATTKSTRRASFFWRVAALNAALFAAAGLLLALTPATISAPLVASEAAVLVAGIMALLAVNVLVIRWAFAPLDRLVERMRSVDPARPGGRLEEQGPAEIRSVVSTFNAMLARLEDERRASARAALLAQEEERKRVAQELHDEIGQSLTAVLITLARAAERCRPETREELLRARELARSGLEDVRGVARRLRPESLDDLGLQSALATLCRRFEDQGGIPVERKFDPGLSRLSPEEELVVYRVAQESLTNIARHAAATRAGLRLERVADGIELTVSDDGCGLNGAAAGSGILGMRERALLIDSQLSLASAPSGGVEVRLRIPRTE